MKVTSTRILQIADVEASRRLRFDSLVNIFQEAAILHTGRVGVKLDSLLDSGKTWVLNKLAIKLDRLPCLDEEIEVHTWSRSLNRFKGLRDYEIYCDGQKVCCASSVWLYIDIARKRPARVPAEYASLYGTIGDMALEFELDGWKASPLSGSDAVYEVTTRVSDYDVNGHVNNAVALQYVETAICRVFGGNMVIEGFKISYLKEIPQETGLIQVRLQRIEKKILFEISEGDKLFIIGEADMPDRFD